MFKYSTVNSNPEAYMRWEEYVIFVISKAQ